MQERLLDSRLGTKEVEETKGYDLHEDHSHRMKPQDAQLSKLLPSKLLDDWMQIYQPQPT